mmetsp:Transcript_22946/g.62256  ORF Transcript_22946/g.62256 Transcript_22946/m.62256 type:complete len:576 (+) Transcript_22946:101-1828(+)
MLAVLLDADALGELLAHLPPEDLLRCAAVCSAWRRTIFTSRDLWAPHFGGMDALDEASRREVSGRAPIDGATGSLTRALAVRRGALANWRSPDPVVSQSVLEPSNAQRMGMVHALAIDDAILATGGSDHCVWLWNLKTRTDTHRLEGHTGAVRCLLLKAKRGTLWSGAWDKTIREWDTHTGECRRVLTNGHERCIMALVLVDDNTLVSAGGEGRVVWWDLRTGARVRACRHACPVLSLALGSDGHTRAVWADGKVRVYDNACARDLLDHVRGTIFTLLSEDSTDTEIENEAVNSTPARSADPPCMEPVATLPGPVTPMWEGPPQPTPRMPNGEPMPAELLAFYHAQGGDATEGGGRAPYVDACLGPGPNALVTMCSHHNLIVDKVPQVSGGEDSSAHPSAAGLRRAALSTHACSGAGACCTLLPEASVAIGGCRTIQPAMNNGILGGPQVIIHVEGSKRPPARIPLLLSPATLAARWDILVVGTQRGRIHVFDFAVAGGHPKLGHVLHGLPVPKWCRNLHAKYSLGRVRRVRVSPRTVIDRQLSLLGSPVMVASAFTVLLLALGVAHFLILPRWQ